MKRIIREKPLNRFSYHRSKPTKRKALTWHEERTWAQEKLAFYAAEPTDAPSGSDIDEYLEVTTEFEDDLLNQKKERAKISKDDPDWESKLYDPTQLSYEKCVELSLIPAREELKQICDDIEAHEKELKKNWKET